MKKRILVAIGILCGTITFAQKKEKQPPPPPPPPAVDVNEVSPPPPPKPVVPPPKVSIQFSKDYQAFLKRNPTVKGIDWSNEQVRIHLKSGKEEVYDLNNEEKAQQFKNKYGKLPAPPPPPPAPKELENN